MGIITPDFSEAVSQENVQPGVYNVRINKYEHKASQKDGAKYLKWTMTIFGCEGDLAKYNNRPVFFNTMLAGKGAGILQSLLIATETAPGAFDPDDLIGKEVQVILVKNIKPDGEEGMPNVKKIQAIK